jgi:hypothetical protein
VMDHIIKNVYSVIIRLKEDMKFGTLCQNICPNTSPPDNEILMSILALVKCFLCSLKTSFYKLSLSCFW